MSNDGNMANNVNGNANANAKPNIPTAGLIQLPEVTVSTNSKPMIGAVQENDTNTRVNAMRKIEIKPVALEALVSTEFAQLSGNFQQQEQEDVEYSIGRKFVELAWTKDCCHQDT